MLALVCITPDLTGTMELQSMAGSRTDSIVSQPPTGICKAGTLFSLCIRIGRVRVDGTRQWALLSCSGLIA